MSCVTGVSATEFTVDEYVIRYVRPATPEIPVPANVASPSVAVADVVPIRLPVAVPLTLTVWTAIDTDALSLSTTLPNASTNATFGWVVKVAPELVPTAAVAPVAVRLRATGSPAVSAIVCVVEDNAPDEY